MSSFLRSLEIAGFKSFARPTTLEFSPGITALVGPNGSGKSNVVEAIRWCLGEQSIRDLRGQRAEDVIHAGRRRVLGSAEVVLSFESSDDRRDALSVQRRVFRSGESEYIVNGRKGRLRDLTAALKSVDIDTARSLVVNQGMADAWLAASAVDRRALIEQAAGLTDYRERRDDARQKIGLTERNIETLETVLAELEPRVRMLRRQARAVQDRDEATGRLQGRLEAWYAHLWMQLTARLERERTAARQLGERRASLAAELASTETQLELQMTREREWHARLQDVTVGLHEAERQRDAALRSRESVATRVTTLQLALEQHRARRDELAAAKRSAVQRREDAARLAHQTERALVEAQEGIEAGRAQVADAQRAVQHLAVEHSGARQRFEAQENALHRARRRLAEVEHGRSIDQQSLDRDRRRLAEHAGQVDRWRHELDQAEALRSDLRASVTEFDAEVESAERQYELLRGRHERLDRIVRRTRALAVEASRAAQAASRVLEGAATETRGTLVERLDVAKGWETAVGSALDAWALASLDERQARHLRRADNHEIEGWRAQLLQDVPPGARWASDVVHGAPDDYAHPLELTLFVDSEDGAGALWEAMCGRQAFRIGTPPLQIVSRGGRCWSAVGVRPASEDDRASRLIEARRSARTTSRRRAELERRVERFERALRIASAAMKEATEHRSVVATARRRAAAELAGVDERVGVLHRRLELSARERSELETDMGAIESRIVEREREVGECRASVETLVRELDDLRPSLDALGERLQRARADSEKARTAGEARSARVSLLGERLSAQRHLQQAATEEISRTEDAMQREEAASAAAEQELARCLVELSEQQEAAAARTRDLDAWQVNAQRVDAEKPVSGPVPDVAELRRRAAASIAEHERALAGLTALEADERTLRADIQRDLAVEVHELPEQIGDVPTHDEIRRLRQRATQYADVEPTVVDEFHRLEERQHGLEHNMADLRASIETLREIMDVADREMKVRFERAFAAVSDEFGRVFRIMLRGGDARLELLPDSGGIDVHAQLPGKRARSSAAFSGGERALIASALLFGVLRIRPTPVCILDEVDAALDESNVDRYLAVLRDISQSTQVIVVTHNRQTMAAADVLYGMTMDDEGVSSTLSLRLDQYATG